jgi:hypothetical protein
MAVAVARRLAVTMHAMLKTGKLFDRSAGASAPNRRLQDYVRLLSAPRCPCRDVANVIPLDGMHCWFSKVRRPNWKTPSAKSRHAAIRRQGWKEPQNPKALFVTLIE